MVSISRPPAGGFIEQFGNTFGTKEVTVTPGTQRPKRAVATYPAVVTARIVQFNVDTPVYQGDHLAWDDPRGGRNEVLAAKVKVNDAGGAAASLAHISVEFTEAGDAVQQKPRTRAEGHVIVVNGSNVNIALEGATITQQVGVSPGYEGLADAVGRALALIEQTAGIDPDEVEVARESATLVVEESAKEEPNPSLIKRALPALRGVLASAASGGAGAAASALIEQLFI